MAGMTCSQCGAPISPGANCCEYCGNPVEVKNVQPQQQPQVFIQPPPPMYQQPMQPMMFPPNGMMNNGIDPSWPIKSKTTAALLAILLGSFGAHKFYLGQIGFGILYLVFCSTGFPLIVGIAEGIYYLVSSDHNFQVKNKVRLQ